MSIANIHHPREAAPGHRAHVGAVVKRNIFPCPCRELNHGHPGRRIAVVSRYFFFSPLVTILVAPVITGMTKYLIFHIRWIYILTFFYSNLFSVFFFIMLLFHAKSKTVPGKTNSFIPRKIQLNIQNHMVIKQSKINIVLLFI
jgi:hypothetical protein